MYGGNYHLLLPYLHSDGNVLFSDHLWWNRWLRLKFWRIVAITGNTYTFHTYPHIHIYTNWIRLNMCLYIPCRLQINLGLSADSYWLPIKRKHAGNFSLKRQKVPIVPSWRHRYTACTPWPGLSNGESGRGSPCSSEGSGPGGWCTRALCFEAWRAKKAIISAS